MTQAQKLQEMGFTVHSSKIGCVVEKDGKKRLFGSATKAIKYADFYFNHPENIFFSVK